MPTITLSKKKLLKEAGKLSDEQLQDRISMLGTDFEEMKEDTIITEVFPNRPDLLSQAGFARALASFTRKKTGLREYKVAPPKVEVIVEKSVEECRPYTACAIVRGLKLDNEAIEEIITMQEKLHVTFGRHRKRCAIGIYPLENIKTPIRFTGLKPSEITFTPLEGKRMSAKQILEEHPKGKEYAHLLAGLKRYACFVDDDNNIMSLTPIINSEHVGRVNEKTTDVFVECSGHNIRIMQECLAIITTSLADMGGAIEACKLKYEHGTTGTITTPTLKPVEWPLDREYINKLLGLELPEKELKECLERMGLGYKNKKALIPAYRTDILHQADLAEDVAIAYGYENFKAELPTTSTTGEEARQSKLERATREVLIGHGLIEMKNYHLCNAQLQKITGTKAKTLTNSVSSEFDTLRTELATSLLSALKKNTHREYPQRVFEIGRVFLKEEEDRIAIALAGERENYTSARQIIDSLLQQLGEEATYKEHKADWLLRGRAATIKTTAREGVIGEVHPRVLEELGIETPVVIAELTL